MDCYKTLLFGVQVCIYGILGGSVTTHSLQVSSQNHSEVIDMGVILKDILKTFGENKPSFSELELEFYSNIKQLKQLDSHDTTYHELYHKNESILEIVENMTTG